MKSYTKFLMFLLLGGVIAIASCKKDESNPTKPDLTVSLNPTAGVPGDVINVVISSNSTLTHLKIEEVISGTSGTVTLKDSAIANKTLAYTYRYTIPQGASGSKQLKITVTDNNNVTNTSTPTITIGAAIKDCENVILGAQSNTTGSSFATVDCSVYKVNEAQASSSKVDFIYYYSPGATLWSPDYSSNSGLTSTYNLNAWSTRNHTIFRYIGNSYPFANIKSNADILAAWNAAQPTQGANTTETGMTAGGSQYYAFKRNDGKYGVIVVNGVSGTTSGTISISVKTQL